jgi:hypothetical protein
LKKNDYTLRVPFRIAGKELEINDTAFEKIINDYNWQLEHEEPFYVLKISGFRTEGEAEDYFRYVHYSLMFTQVEEKLSISHVNKLGEVKYNNDPEESARNFEKNFKMPYDGPIHGYFDKVNPVIYPSNKRFIIFGANGAVVKTPMSADRILSTIEKGVSCVIDNEEFKIDAKLQTALDLYSTFWYESSDNARFLTLMMVFEVLKIENDRSQKEIEYINKWRNEVKVIMKNCKDGSSEYKSWASLLGNLDNSRKISITNGIKMLISELFEGDEKKKYLRDIGMLYGDRSTLVHDGYLEKNELRTDIDKAKNILESVLKKKLDQSD